MFKEQHGEVNIGGQSSRYKIYQVKYSTIYTPLINNKLIPPKRQFPNINSCYGRIIIKGLYIKNREFQALGPV